MRTFAIDVKPMEDMEHITKPEVIARATPRLRQVRGNQSMPFHMVARCVSLCRGTSAKMARV